VTRAQLSVVLAEVGYLRWSNEELAGRLVEVTCLRDESTDWARGGAAMVQVNGNRCVEATIELVHQRG
jgi:hypothetical protein